MATVWMRSSIGVVDTLTWGPYDLPAGTTKTQGSPDNLPVRRLVVLFDRVALKAVRSMWSDAVTGAYQFKSLRAGTYFVVSFDHTGQYSGVIETDIVVPTPPTP